MTRKKKGADMQFSCDERGNGMERVSSDAASIRQRGNAYLIVVSMGYDHEGKRRPAQQKTVHPPKDLTKKQTEKWLNEQATLFEMECKEVEPQEKPDMTFAEYTEYWLREVAPLKLAKSAQVRDKQDIDRILPALGR